MGSRDRDSTQALIADAEALIKNKAAGGKAGGTKDAPPPTRELVSDSEKLIKKRPDEAPTGGNRMLLWGVVVAAAAAGLAFYFMK